MRFAKGHQKFRALSKDQKVFAKISIKWALFNAALKTYAEWQVKNKLCYIQMGPWIIKETGHKKLERSSVWWSRWLHYVTKTHLSFFSDAMDPPQIFGLGPFSHIICIICPPVWMVTLYKWAHMFFVGSCMLWPVEPKFAVDHKNLGRGAWKLR